MATTFLQLSNELLRESNEVVLTSSKFASAVGIQQHVKDCVNKAYSDIVSAEPRWSFLATGESGSTDPLYGNVYVETVAGTRWYELKASSSAVTTDYSAINWDDFYLTTISVSGESAPYVSKNLRFVTLEDWKDFRREAENIDDADSQNWGEPNVVFRSTDGRKFGLSPIPKKVYRAWYFAWDLPTALSAHGDTIVFPDMYTTVLLARARYYMHQFKDNPQTAAFALQDYKDGLRQMRSNLLNPAPKYIADDRVRVV
jgi:hypothetical protein|tara:strand:- start:2214 stop:2984 length:771 start_codon:yes stop_codon:yes gene_type:complete